jgi:sulfur carrier protein
MEITVNNKTVTTAAASLGALAAEMTLPAKGVAMAVNNEMIPRSDWESTAIREGDSVVIIKAVCGG